MVKKTKSRSTNEHVDTALVAKAERAGRTQPRKEEKQGRGSRGREKPKIEYADAALVVEAERLVRKERSWPLAKLLPNSLSDGARAEVERRLLQCGLERHGNAIRVPLDAQLRALLQTGTHLPMIGITKHIRGALKEEIEGVVRRLVRDKQAVVILRGKGELVVRADARVLSTPEVVRLRKVVDELTHLLDPKDSNQSFKGEARTLLRDDVEQLLDGLLERRVERPALPAPLVRAPAAAPRQMVGVALRRLEDPKLKIVRIPDLVRSLDGKLSLSEVHEALNDAADTGEIELHPDAGSEFLPVEDAVLCPPGPRNTVFSYARLLAP